VFAESLAKTDEVAIEATVNTFAIARPLEEHMARVVISNPLRTRTIAEAKVKTDKVDARVLAELLAAGYLPGIWRPDDDLQALRRLVARRSGMVRERTRLKNTRAAILHRNLLPRCPAAHNPWRRPHGLALAGGRDRRDRALPLGPPPLRLGRPHPDRALLRRQGPARPHLAARITARPLGPGRRRAEGRPGRRAPCAPPSSGSPSATGGTSPRSPSQDACSPSATTGCATARSAASTIRGQRARAPSGQRDERLPTA
jgi:hypothetical protein